MITLTKSGNTIVFEFDDNSGYLQNGTIEVPLNSLSLITDESEMATFRKSASNDIFVSARYDDFGMTKAELEQFYKDNMVGSTGGGGGGITSGEVQTMIDESISGKADTTAVTEAISEATSGKVDTSTFETYSGDVETALGGKQDTLRAGDGISIDSNDTINTYYRGWADFEQYDFRPSGSFYVVVGFDCAGHTDGSARFEFEVDNERKEVTIHFDSSTGSWTCDSWEDPHICDDLWQYLNIYYNGDSIFLVEPYVDVTANDDGCVRFTYDLIGAGTTTDALDAVFGNLENKADATAVTEAIRAATSGKVDTTTYTAYTASTDAALSGKADTSAVTEAISAATSGLQETLVSGTNIKTINNESILGSGNITISGGSGNNTVELTQAEYDALVSGGTVDPTTYYIITDATPIDLSGYAQTSAVTEAISAATSGKVDTSSVVTAVTSASTDSEIPTAKAVYDAIPTGGTGGGKAISAGTNISVTTGETADTVSCTLPITTYGHSSLPSIKLGKGGYFSAVTFNNASNLDSVVFGSQISAATQYSIIGGVGNKVYGTNDNVSYSAVFGNSNDVKNSYAIVGGCSNKLSGGTSPDGIIAYSGINSKAVFGAYNQAFGTNGLMSGYFNDTKNFSEFVSGYYNNSVSASTTLGNSGNTLFSVGNGTSTDARHNAFEIRQNGDIYITLDGQDVKLQDQLGGGSITIDPTLDSGSTNPVANSAITTAFDNVDSRLSEDEEVTAAALNNLNDKFGGLQLVKLTQQEYDALVSGGTVDSSTLYIITNVVN